MNRITGIFKNNKALITYLTAGDPDISKTEEYILTMALNGSDLIEIGIPFSDPVADGKTIQNAMVRALSKNISLYDIFDIVINVRKKIDIPLVFMTYLNPMFFYGYEKFFKRCKQVELDGIIVPDMPFEEQEEVKCFAKKYNITIITLIAPTSKKRIFFLAKQAEGFIYLVSSLGVTGVRSRITTDIRSIVSEIKKVTDTPVAVGFGVSNASQAKEITKYADGVIIGSAVVKIIEQHKDNAVAKLANYTSEIKKSILEGREKILVSQKEIYAHSANDKGVCQTLLEHSNNVAEIASAFAVNFSSQDWTYDIGLLHDLGKSSKAFQDYLQKSSSQDSDEDGEYALKTNHSGAGAIYAAEKLKCIGKVMAYCIAGHHVGLGDWTSIQERIGETGGGKDKKYFDSQVCEYVQNRLSIKNNLLPPKLNNFRNDMHLWVRMLYSCLVDADRLDTEKFLNEEKHKKRAKFSSLNDLYNKFLKGREDKIKSASSTKLNKIRKNIFDCCIEAANKVPGFFELAVPTGGGKTLSAMAFAFKHAKIHNKDRIIYVIPYTSIIEQTAKILKDILGDENVVEHHSSIDPNKETESSRLASENWDSSIIVTTNVQFFESLYANKSSKCRKLHNITNSIIILDEAQMLPTELLYPCVDAMKQLVNNYKTTILFSTATPLDFSEKMTEINPKFPTINQIEKIIPENMNLYNELKRVNYNFLPKNSESDSWDKIASKLNQHEQVLCVVNTRKDCYDLFKCMPKGTVHLSALMCAQHRSTKIDDIKKKLASKKEIRVISTSLIEAGVDIDFPIVFRAFAGMPSIIQTAGRCNREGGNIANGKVFVFNAPSVIPVGLMRKSADSTRDLMSRASFQIDTADISKEFFKLFVSKANEIGYRKLNEALIQDACLGKFQFSSYAKDFNLIDDKYNKAVIIKYNNNNGLIDKLRYAGIDKNLMRELQRYIVNIPDIKFRDMQSNGLIEEVQCGIFIQDADGFYDEEVGLNIFDDKYGLEIGQI
jgi:CRISPR-associated endonuclease/helicase Cas3